MCVSAIATDTPLDCFLDLEWILFVLSALRIGWRIVFLMSQMSNVNGIKQHLLAQFLSLLGFLNCYRVNTRVFSRIVAKAEPLHQSGAKSFIIPLSL